jgi:coronin-1B/1C/6
MSRFIRASKFRHVYGTPTKREHCYENIKASMNAWDTNIINVNPAYTRHHLPNRVEFSCY